MAHCVVRAAEEILDKEFPVLNRGFIRLVDYLGGMIGWFNRPGFPTAKEQRPTGKTRPSSITSFGTSIPFAL